MKKSIINFVELVCSLLTKENKPEVVVVTVYENASQISMSLEEFVNHYNPEDVGKGLCHLIFKIEGNGNLLATFSLNDMYNCSGILIFSELIIHKNHRNKGLSKAVTGFIVDFAKYYGYGVLQAVDLDSNEFQKKSFLKNNWKTVSSFVNPKTGNKLNVWFHTLNEI